MFKFNSHLLTFLFIANFLQAQLDFSEAHLISESLLTTMDSTIKAGTYENITSVLIAKDGNLLFEKYYNGANQNSKHNTRSATKTMAALLTGIAVDKGFIKSEKDKIYTYLKHKMPVQNADPRKEKITIEDLLTMSSILECDDNNSHSRGNEERMYLIEDWAQFFIDLPIKSYTFNPKPEELPYGRSMSYCSAGSAAVAEILQSAIGSDLATFATKNLFNPLNIENFILHRTPTGVLNTAGGSEYQSRDLLKLIQLCLQKGRWQNKQIISADWLAKATSAKVNAWPGMDYGYLFWIRKYGAGEGVQCFAMAGNGGNKIIAFPDLNLVAVLTSTNYNNRNAHNYTDEILNKYIMPAMVKQ